MVKCPLCKGKGVVASFKNLTIPERIKLVKKLKKQGLTVREMMVILEFKSPRSIQVLFTQ